jgi:hypothetical protein
MNAKQKAKCFGFLKFDICEKNKKTNGGNLTHRHQEE